MLFRSTLAAFQPATRLALEEKGLIAPTVQMILRLSNKNVAKPEDYLTPQAHPTVLDAGQLDVEKMVRTAHAMNAAEIPGLAALTVKEETIGRPGTDYFSPLPENLFDTPFAIARVARSLDSERRLVISAEASRDPNGRPLTFHWVLLRGDSSTIRITPLNKAGTVAEIIIPHQTRRPIWPGSPLESSRVDIGVFTHNGVHYSAPSFVSIQYLENETRVYDGKRLLSVEYKSAERGGYYVDPFLEYAKDWKDEYHYDDQGHRLGWMRTLPDGTHADYTAEGALIQSRDAQGRAKEARLVRYNLTPATEKTIPTLVPVPAAETITYDYTSDQDRTGKIRLTPAVTQK